LEVRVPERVKRVFLSSTGRDLAEYREVVAAAINALDDFKVVRMEDFGARDWAADEFCRRKVGECDVYLGLIGHFYGSIPEGRERSFTEREYDAAVETGKSLLLFVANEEFSMPVSLMRDPAARWEKAEAFRGRARKDRIVQFFGSGERGAEVLARGVTNALLQLELEKPAAPPVSPQPVDLVECERRYLAHVAERYRYLDFRGMGVSNRLPVRLRLLDVYVPLRVRLAVPEGEAWKEDLRLAGRRLSKYEQEAIGRVGAPQPVLELVQKEDGVILLGDPGAGKSTFLKYLALLLSERRGAEIGLEGRVPFLVPLAAYADWLVSRDIRLDHFVSESFANRAGDLPLDRLLAEALRAGRALLLLDGLDEIRDRGRQQTVVDRVRDFFSFHRGAGNKIVLSSRIVGYKEIRSVAEGLREGTLVDFEEQEIEMFLDRWVQVQEEAALGVGVSALESAARERQELGEAIQKSQAVRALAANPLLLTILALMKRQGVSLPEQRAKLYHTYIRALLEDWNRARSLSGRPVAERSADELLKILTPLALWIQETSPGIGLVRRGELESQLEAIHAKRGEEDPAARRRDFLRDLSECSLLIERGNDQFGFIHLTFLEYLAACELAKQEQFGLEPFLAALAQRFGIPAWREVLLLTVGHLGVVQGREISAANVLLYWAEKQPGPKGESIILAGDALADLGPVGVAPDVMKRICAALLQTLRDDELVAPARRAAAGGTLARVGDPRPEVMTIEGMRFCWVPPGVFWMGTKREQEQSGDDAESPQSEVDLSYGYWIGLYPITVAQFCNFLELHELDLGPHAGLRAEGNSPMSTVTWYEAARFCEWLTTTARAHNWLSENYIATLPSETEWEKAARGGLRLPMAPKVGGWADLEGGGPSAVIPNPRMIRRFPWGEVFDPGKANTGQSGIRRRSAVGCFPGGACPSGAEDLSGNVSEWTRSRWMRYPYEVSAVREPSTPSQYLTMVLRGGSVLGGPWWARCASRYHGYPGTRSVGFGFRIVVRPI
jgi:formylglycine-generating enzyme required for sulfatase activity/energy-coupling factor transporter ATP-binding protein EcfA2